MALEEIKLWAIDGVGGAEPVAPAEQIESERLLEDTLVKNPDMLMPGLTLVGRQTPTEGGPLDLLGIDEDGRLVVFELKRGTLSREAVAQVIDYASFLEDRPDDDLAKYVSDRSGAHRTTRIEDFDEWYDAKSGGQGFSALKPVRMVLVGLGVDETTNRMVRFLADQGVNISLLTFHGYNYNGNTLLAKQVQVEPDLDSSNRSGKATSRLSQRELIEGVEYRVKQYEEQWEEGYVLWNTARRMFRELWDISRERVARTNSDWALHRINFNLPVTRRSRRYAAVQLSPWDHQRWVEVIFFPQAVELRLEEFTQLRKEIPYFTYPADSPAKESGVLEVKFTLKSLSEWDTHKEKLATVTRSVYEALLASEDE